MGKSIKLYVHGDSRSLRRTFGAIIFMTCVWYAGQVPAAAPIFSESLIDNAMSLPLLRLGDPAELSEVNYPYGRVGPGVHFLALVAFFDPDAQTTSGDDVADRVIAHLEHVVLPANAPRLVGGMYAWNDHHLGGIIALAKHTAEVWNALNASTKERLQWLMNAGTYVGNLQHNADNECYLTPFLDHMVVGSGGGTNPNQANGMTAWMSYAYIYYGGAAAVNSMLAAYDPNMLVNKATEFGWQTISAWASREESQEMFTGGGYVATDRGNCSVQAQGVRAPFTFNGRTVSGDPACPSWTLRPGPVPYEPFQLFKRSEYEWNLAAEVVDSACITTPTCGERGHIKPGFSSPHLGEIGMFLEYNINGRSSPSYSAIGRRISVFHIATLMATGFWDSDDQEYAEVLQRLSKAMDVYKYRDTNNAWYDPDKCKFTKANRVFSGHDFVDEIWRALGSLEWTLDDVGSGGGSPLPEPTRLRVR